ncbi:MAG: hypothetical protein COS99_02955 [Candidatus Omnitrophica bacterium CG07_land_8_20_14_0_80_42_15]|uniref:PilZ domain-containing protein n=1 Tax=Candidatus Aquitaenariimonas noxiae TaxID=1974741 RepID=A0A2J0L3Q8_9BACT|nr:MAG: hypothetical protein COS99_02955 [Candidatus Omnitrophica bacterium CG07_land_8_20_14_0_80_42_15]
MSIERREYLRVKKILPVIIHRPYFERDVETIDVSLGGIAVCRAQRHYDISTDVYIELVLPEGDSVFCEAKVVWIHPNTKDADSYQLGLQFLDMKQSDKEKLNIQLSK